MATVTAGQQLGIRWRGASGPVQDAIRRLRLDPTANGGEQISSWATFVDAAGVSVYIARGFRLGGDMQAFIPQTLMWQSYFEPYPTNNAGYIARSHFTRQFPRDFLG